MEAETPVATESGTGNAEVALPLRIVVFAMVLATAFSMAFVPLRTSQDEWWHLKAGKWITEHGRLPQYDIFTYTGEKTVWHNHEWLAQVVFYSIYAAGEEYVIGGLRALILFKSVLVVLTFAMLAWLCRLRGSSWAAALLVVAVGAFISRSSISLRPPIFSYLLMVTYLMVLYCHKQGRGRRWLVWLLVPLMVVWANLHGMCILGVFIAGCFAAGEVLENAVRLVREHAFREQRLAGILRALSGGRFVLFTLLTLGLAVAATANPSGYHIFLLGRKFTGDPLLREVIAEMLPSPWLFQYGQFIPGFAMFWIAAVAFPVLLAARKFRLPFAVDYLLAGFFLYQAVMHWRLLPLYAIGAGAPVALLLSGLAQARWSRLVLAGVTALASVVFVFAIGEPPPQTFFRRNLDLARGYFHGLFEYPEPLMKFVIRTRFPDRLFSEINYCGYAMWWLSPEHHKLFTDNRFDVFGSEFYPYEATVVEGREDGKFVDERWDQILDRYGVNFIIIHRSAAVNAKLRAHGWLHVYYFIPPGGQRSDGFNVWLRNDPKFADVAERAKENFRSQHPGWAAPEEFDRAK